MVPDAVTRISSSALTISTPPPPPPPPPDQSLVGLPPVSVQLLLGEVSPPPPPPPPPTGAISSPVMRRLRLMSIALPQKLLSWRVSVNSASPGSPPARNCERLADEPLQPAPP